MKSRSAINVSIIGLLFIVLIQLGGMFYAYKAQMKEAEQSINKYFWMAFTETVDDIVNNLPYPDGTKVNIIYYPARLKLNKNEFANLGMQQTAQVLRKVYGLKEFPLAKLDSILHKKLEYASISGKVAIELFNVNTGEVLESTNPGMHSSIVSITSEKAFTYKDKGEAVRAVVVFPFADIMRNVLVLFAVTFLLLGVAVYILVLQIKSLITQQSNLQEQQQDFYALAEQMREPVIEIISEMPGEKWDVIEEKSIALVGMTEKRLSKAKAEASLNPARKRISLKTFSVIGLTGIFLLLAIWSAYLYRISYERMEFNVQDNFEKAFYDETYYNRCISFFSVYKDRKEVVTVTRNTPYVDRFLKNIRKLSAEKRYHYWMNGIVVYHIYNKYDVNSQLHAAYTMQDTINKIAAPPIVFSAQFADSVFALELRKNGISNKSGIQRLKYPSEELLDHTGSPRVGIMDMTTKLIPLNKDSTECVRGVVLSPQRHIIASIWYMLLPLGITFLFICICVGIQIHIGRMQRRLKQFQKDFTYSMIHDMKSPLNSIMVGAHILLGGKLADKPEKIEKYKQLMQDECNHLLTLSGRVLMLTQIDRGELQLHKETVALPPLLKDITERFSLKAIKKVRFWMDCKKNCTVYADMFCLREVINNLIDNAIKYSKDEVEIALSCEESDGFTLIKVRDNGIGIPLKEQQKIFDKFERLPAGSRKSGVSGFGLGLNYVQQVMEAHNGKVAVESIEGSYSEFTISFPLS